MSTNFNLTTPSFEGPLETLLNLIEARKMSISDISLAEVTDTYLAYVEKLPELPLGETAQFILVASTLLLIKSRTLLPTLELSEEERQSVEELETRLARYAIIRRASRALRKEWDKAPLVLSRRVPVRSSIFSPAETTVERAYQAVRSIINALPQPESLVQASVAPVLALEDVIVRLHRRLSSAIKARFSELTKSAERHEVIVYFLAMLELVHAGSASVTQEKLFSDITIEIEHLTGAPKYGT